jgi:hypothetical protein
MAVVRGPLLSFGASGQIAKTQVYSRWKGRPYVRQLVTPANPRSTAQTQTRSVFSWLNSVWKVAPSVLQDPWTQFAKGQVLTNRNAWLQKNIALLREQTTLDGIVLSPGAAGGLTVTPAISGGAGSITAALTAPAPLPPGWTIITAVAVAILEQDPQTDTDYTVEFAADATTPYSVVISGLDPGDYVAGAWFVYQRSALVTDLAYGSSIGEIVTVT